MAQNYASIISGSALKILSNIVVLWSTVNKIHLSEVYQKLLLLAKWIILSSLWLTTMHASISESVLTL